MKMDNLLNTVHVIILSFLTSVFHFFIFAIIIVLYMIMISWPPSVWILIIPYFIIPFMSGLISYELVRRYRSKFCQIKPTVKDYNYKLIARMIAILLVIMLGYLFSKNQRAPILISERLNHLGSLGEFLEFQLTNLFFYLIVAIFPLTYAFFEFSHERKIRD